jgi:hypothetical protein
MDKKTGENGYYDVGVKEPVSGETRVTGQEGPLPELNYVDVSEGTALGTEGLKTAGGKRRRLVRGFLILATLALIVIGGFFWLSGSGRKKIDLAVRDQNAQTEPTPQKIEDMTAQAIAEVRGGADASPAPSPVVAASPETATARDATPVTIPLGGTVASVESPPAPASAPSAGAPARPQEAVSGRNMEQSIRCAPVKKDSPASSKAPSAPKTPVGTPPATTAGLEKTVTLPPFGALLPVRTLGAIYTLRSSLARFELTRDMRGNGWTMKKGTVLVGQQMGSELDRAFVKLTGFIEPNSGKFVKLTGDLLGADGAPGLRGKRRRVGSRWARVLSRAAGAAVTLGQAALSRGGTIVNVPGVVTPEIQGFTSSAVNNREFVEAPAGAAAFALITDLPKEIRGVDAQPGAGDADDASLGDEELAKLVTEGSPEQIRAALPRMPPELRRIAEAVLKESSN